MTRWLDQVDDREKYMRELDRFYGMEPDPAYELDRRLREQDRSDEMTPARDLYPVDA